MLVSIVSLQRLPDKPEPAPPPPEPTNFMVTSPLSNPRAFAGCRLSFRRSLSLTPCSTKTCVPCASQRDSCVACVLGGHVPALTRNGVAHLVRSGPQRHVLGASNTCQQIANDRYLAAAAVCLDVFDSLFFRGSHVVLRRFREFDDLRNRLIQVMCDV